MWFVASAAVVTLDSIEILKTHEWLPSKPTVYFHCKGEDKIVLPDVKEKRVNYSFRGEESWQVYISAICYLFQVGNGFRYSCCLALAYVS